MQSKLKHNNEIKNEKQIEGTNLISSRDEMHKDEHRER